MIKYDIYFMEVREDVGWCGSERRYKIVWKREYIGGCGSERYIFVVRDFVVVQGFKGGEI